MMTAEDNNVTCFQDKHILVVGLARSGAGAVSVLTKLGAQVSVTDSKPEQELLPLTALLPDRVELYAGECPDRIVERADMLVVSPGVPLRAPVVARAMEQDIPVIGELELAYRAFQTLAKQSASPPRFIGITGTNGKSTTTVLINLMLRRSGMGTVLGGNIGNALTEEFVRAADAESGGGLPLSTVNYIVSEISSFQLETIASFRPSIAAILNITPDHLDRYAGIEDYAAAKARIYENQSSADTLIVNADDPLLGKMVHRLERDQTGERPRILSFSSTEKTEGIYCSRGSIYLNAHVRGLTERHRELIRVEEIRIQGAHNIENAMAAALVSLSAGASPDAVVAVLKEFPGLEHRLEHVRELRGVHYINDSKGTNVGAVAKSLEGLERVVLIMGGRDKGGDFSSLRKLVTDKVKTLIVMGEAENTIAGALSGTADISSVPGLEEAVSLAAASASAGDVVLLSPGCTSFDMFRDFEERGRKFRELVRSIGAER